jgi:hypothetical protein
VVFLAHFTGSGINSVLDFETGDYFAYLEEAVAWHKMEMKTPKRVVVAGFEK